MRRVSIRKKRDRPPYRPGWEWLELRHRRRTDLPPVVSGPDAKPAGHLTCPMHCGAASFNIRMAMSRREPAVREPCNASRVASRACVSARVAVGRRVADATPDPGAHTSRPSARNLRSPPGHKRIIGKAGDSDVSRHDHPTRHHVSCPIGASRGRRCQAQRAMPLPRAPRIGIRSRWMTPSTPGFATRSPAAAQRTTAIGAAAPCKERA